MIPLRDINHATTSRPIATYTLIALNAAAFLYQLTLSGFASQHFVLEHGFVPRELLRGELSAVIGAVTSMFLHGGVMHFASNMWFLHVFGDNVEDALGSRRYVAFYLVCGLVAAAAQFAINPSSAVPMIGASGALSGVLGAYFKLFPHARVQAFIPIFIVGIVRVLPAVLFLGLWFGLQLLQGVGSLGLRTQGGGVAFFAHIGGFVAGMLLVRVIGRRGGGDGGGASRVRDWSKPRERGPYYQGSRGWDA